MLCNDCLLINVLSLIIYFYCLSRFLFYHSHSCQVLVILLVLRLWPILLMSDDSSLFSSVFYFNRRHNRLNINSFKLLIILNNNFIISFWVWLNYEAIDHSWWLFVINSCISMRQIQFLVCWCQTSVSFMHSFIHTSVHFF